MQSVLNPCLITVKNYRCFEDTSPLRVQLGREFVALVGQNNSGKSSFLRMFWELRPLWPAAASGIASGKGNCGINYQDVPDAEEIFSHKNSRPIQINLAFERNNVDLNRQFVSGLVLTANRDQPNHWGFEFQVSDGNAVPPQTYRLENDLLLAHDRPEIDCGAVLSTLRALTNVLYIGPFRNAINEGAGNYFDLAIGTSFVAMWNSWKSGDSHSQMRLVNKITSDLTHIFEFDRLEINAAASGKTLKVFVDGQPYRLSELGAGLSQFIVVLTNAAIRKPALILIDEPELNLHPALQLDFLTSLASYATNGVIFATHSIGLARSAAEHVYSFQKKQGRAVVRPFEELRNYAEFAGEMSFSSFKDMGFNALLLVEGIKDVKPVMQLLRNIRKDHRVVVLPLRGDELARGDAEHELSELKRISDKVFALVDSERSSQDESPIPARVGFEATCRSLGITVCVTKRRALENYFTDTAVKAALGDDFQALGPYQRLSDAARPWSKDKNWRIARAMATDSLANTDVGDFLAAI